MLRQSFHLYDNRFQKTLHENRKYFFIHQNFTAFNAMSIIQYVLSKKNPESFIQ